MDRKSTVMVFITKFYLVFLAFTIPMDWFSPTGLLLREGGARPAIPLMIAASVFLLCSRWKGFLYALPASNRQVLWLFCGIMISGCFAFELNLIFGWSAFGQAKDPLVQFITQGMLLLIVPLIVVTHAELFAEEEWCRWLMGAIPWVASVHLIVIALNAMQLLNFAALPLSLFRNTEVSVRVAGLMSEPSYVGTMSALYGLPLIFVRPRQTQRLRILLAVLFFASALYANAKTVVPVTLCGLAGYFWYGRIRLLTPRRVLAALCIAAIALAVVVSNSTFDLEENLSSAMRLGSTITAFNAAIAGYGLTGVGLGQFHFIYSQRFMPRFLLLSAEALSVMSSASQQRASTFNVLARYWIETGLLGMFLFIGLLRKLFMMARADQRFGSLMGVLFIATSIGFLLTQDPYCYPPLLLGCALVLGAHNRRTPAFAEGQG